MPRAKKGQPNKSDFVRQHPTLSPAEVVAKAKEAGLTVSTNLVYMVRGRAKAAAKPAKAAKPAAKPLAKAPAKAPAAAAPKAPALPTGKVGSPTASDFIRTLPAGISAKEAVAKGAAMGFKFTPNLFYLVRTRAKKAAGKASRPAKIVAPKPVAAKAVAPKAAAAAGPDASAETVILRLILRHGVDYVRQLVDGAVARATAVLAG